jgi:hypothetical protein
MCDQGKCATPEEDVMKTTTPDRNIDFTLADLAALGMGHLAYVRPMRADEVRKLVPQAQDLPADIDLFALLGADGTPIMIADSRAELTANAWENQLVTVSVH